jgi:NitT/TauT family transport system permease protein
VTHEELILEILTRVRSKLASVSLIVAFFVIWEALCRILGISEFVLPKPSQILVTLVSQFGALLPHILHTLYTTIIGFVLGLVVGVFLGGIIGTSRLAYDTAYPLLIGFSSIPKVAIIPIFVVWFGAGAIPAVLTSLAICFFPIAVNVATGLATTEPELEDVLKALGASKFDVFWNVGLPRTMPYLFASLKVAITVAFIGTITSETIASNSGIGTVMMIAAANFDLPLVFAGLFSVSILGIALYAISAFIERRVTGWANRANEFAIR